MGAWCLDWLAFGPACGSSKHTGDEAREQLAAAPSASLCHPLPLLPAPAKSEPDSKLWRSLDGVVDGPARLLLESRLTSRMPQAG